MIILPQNWRGKVKTTTVSLSNIMSHYDISIFYVCPTSGSSFAAKAVEGSKRAGGASLAVLIKNMYAFPHVSMVWPTFPKRE